MTVDEFPATYKARMIAAYPVIAQMTADEAYFADAAARDEAFGRILASKNLRKTHELFLAAERAAENDVTPWWVCPTCGFDAKAFEPRPEAQPGAIRWHLEGAKIGRAICEPGATA